MLLAGLVLLPAVRVGLCTLGLRRVLALLGNPSDGFCHVPASPAARVSAPAVPSVLRPVAQASSCDPSVAAPVSDANLACGAWRTARLVAVAAQYTGGSCLVRSILLARLLEGQGIQAQLRIGVRKGENGFEAHAWVETDGVILNEAPDVSDRFAAFDRNFAIARVNWR